MNSKQLTHPSVLAGPWILVILAEKPTHGYELIERLHEVGFEWGSRSGPIYRELTKMAGVGLVTSTLVSLDAGPTRRVYELTAAGRDELDESIVAIRTLADVIGDLLGRYERLPR